MRQIYCNVFFLLSACVEHLEMGGWFGMAAFIEIYFDRSLMQFVLLLEWPDLRNSQFKN